MIKQNKIRPNSKLKISHNKFVSHIIGEKSLGYFAADEAIKLAAKTAKRYGIGIVTISDSYPTGCLGQYTESLTKSNFIGIAISHSPEIVTAFGTAQKVFGTTGHSFGFPGRNIPYIYDSSIGSITNGQIMYSAKRNSRLPSSTVLTQNGEYTNDPKLVIDENGIFNGIIAVAGDRFAHKFSGFAGSLELLLRLALINNQIINGDYAYSMMFAIDPSLFGDKEKYKELVEALENKIVSAKRDKDVKRVYFAGQKSHELREKNSKLNETLISNETFYALF